MNRSGLLPGWPFALLGLVFALLVAGGQRAVTGEVNWTFVTISGALFALGSGVIVGMRRLAGAGSRGEVHEFRRGMPWPPEAADADPRNFRGDRFDKFTDRARRVLTLAQEEAQRFNHNYIGTEHLLLGLVREGDGVAAKVLANLGVELNKVRSAVEFIIGRGDRAVLGEIGLTPRGKKVIELAVDEARRLNHHYVGTEHLLLGLVREGEGIAAAVLESLGVNLDRVRAETTRVLSQSLPTTAARKFTRDADADDDERDTYPGIDVMSPRFDASMQRTLMLAREEALRFCRPSIDQEHLLLALLRDADGLAARVFQEMSVQPVDVRAEVELWLLRGNRVMLDRLDFDPDAERIIRAALREAQADGGRDAGTEHLLSALLGRSGHLPESIMGTYGVTTSRVREAIVRLRAAEHAPPQEDESSEP